MRKRFVWGAAVAGALVVGSALGEHRDLSASDPLDKGDPTGLSGRISDEVNSVVVFGSNVPRRVKRSLAWVVPETSSGLNNSLVRVVNGRILGAVSVFSTTGNPNLLLYIEALDGPPSGTNTNVQIDELPNNRSNTLGQMLSNGRLIYRANFAGTAQNNLEAVLGDVQSQQPPYVEPAVGAEILTGVCTSGGTSTDCFLGIPAAIEADGGRIWVGNTNFENNRNDPNLVPRGLNIWLYDGSPQPINRPRYHYFQNRAGEFANNNGVPVDPLADARQTQPVLARVGDYRYVIFGINDTHNGGSSRPGLLCVDPFELNDPYDPNQGNTYAPFADALAVLPPQRWRFVDHTATGGGGEPFENKHFNMNSKGQIAVLAELRDPNDPNNNARRSFAVLRYDPIISGGLITGFRAPVTIADAGPVDTVAEGLAGGLASDLISGVGINDAGNIVFSGNYDPDPNDPNNPLLTAVYFYEAATGRIHQLIRQGDTVGTDPTLKIDGFFPQTGSDSIFATSIAPEADVIVANFRHNAQVQGDYSGTVVLDLRREQPPCPEDCDPNGRIDLGDLALLLSCYNTGTCCDIDGDRDTDLSDLAALLAKFQTPCP